jgi:acyl-CoA thioesterase
MTQLAESIAVTDFDRTTALIPVEGRPGEFLVDLDGGWSSLVGVHGGYMCALAVRGAESMAPGRLVRTLSTSFLRSGRVGPAVLSMRELRRGRSITTMVAELVQDDQILIVSRLTLMTARSGLEWSERRPPHLPPPADCVPFSPPAEVVSFGRFELRFDPGRMPFTGERAHLGGYVRPLEARPVDAAWLVMAADCFPPPAFARAEPPTGGVSVDLTVHVHRSGFVLGDDAWLAGCFEIDDSTGGLAVERGRIMQMDGTVVAELFHTRLTAQN